MSPATPDTPDSYTEWLSIPPGERPPNHYVLLGLKRYESDAEVIWQAVDAQTGIVRPRCLKHPKVGTQILNEIAEAGACLLDPDRKATYDETLRHGAPPDQAEADRPAAPPTAPPPLPADFLRLPEDEPREKAEGTEQVTSGRLSAKAAWLAKSHGLRQCPQCNALFSTHHRRRVRKRCPECGAPLAEEGDEAAALLSPPPLPTGSVPRQTPARSTVRVLLMLAVGGLLSLVVTASILIGVRLRDDGRDVAQGESGDRPAAESVTAAPPASVESVTEPDGATQEADGVDDGSSPAPHVKPEESEGVLAREEVPEAREDEPAWAPGEEVRRSGTLVKLHGREGELHLVIQFGESVDFLGEGSYMEAFTRTEDFGAEVSDYRCQDDGRAPEADVVVVEGTCCLPEAAAFRLADPAVPLVELKAVEREGEPDSRAVVGRKRDPSTFRTEGAPSRLTQVLRVYPRSGEEIEFSASFRSFDSFPSSGTVEVSPVEGGRRSAAVSFPRLSSEDFSDYKEGDQVTVEAVVGEGAEPAELRLEGKMICRRQDPKSRITPKGRRIPPRSFEEERLQWVAICQDPEQHLGERLEAVGVYAGRTGDGSDAEGGSTIQIAHVCFGYEGVSMPWTPQQPARDLEAALQPDDEVLFEAMVVGARRGGPVVHLVRLARRAEPDKEVAFRYDDPAVTLGGELSCLAAHEQTITAVASSPDGERLATAGTDSSGSTAKIWNAETARLVSTLARSHWRGAIDVLAWSPDGRQLATLRSHPAGIRFWDASDGTEIKIRTDKRTAGLPDALSLSWNPRDDRLAVGTVGGFFYVFAFDPNRPMSPKPRGERGGATASVAWSDDGNYLATSHFRQGVFVWDSVRKLAPQALGYDKLPVVREGSPTPQAAYAPAGPVDFFLIDWSPKGNFLALAEQGIAIWDLSNGSDAVLKHRIIPRPAGPTYLAVAWSPDGSRLAASDTEHCVTLWDTRTGQESLRFDCLANAVGLVWTADGKRLTTAGADGKLRGWNVAPGMRKLTR